MASGATSQAQASQVKRTSFGGFPGSSASMLLDRSKIGIRGSTPDSEALVSSDDEQDHHHRLHPVTSNPNSKSNRRSSWLTETQQSPIRKSSLGGNGPFTPTSPNSSAPSSEQSIWGNSGGPITASTIGRGHSTNNSFPWGNPIWNNDVQKGPPHRLTEVLPSPTSIVPPGSSSLYNEEPLRSPPPGQENLAESSIPFAIPLQPTLKTYRSQSYSVGQLDPESSNPPPTTYAGYGVVGRSRNGMPYANLQHRPSRPSMLGDLSHDPSLLGQVQEVEDDEESSTGSESGVQLSTTQARTIEQLAMENAMLRQAAAEQLERESVRSRGHLPTGSTMKGSRTNPHSSSQRVYSSMSDEIEHALYDMDDTEESPLSKHQVLDSRRSSEKMAKSVNQSMIAAMPENRSIESVKKGHWQSSLGFGGIGEPPQSRRHSFADVPTRQNSIGSGSDVNGQTTVVDTGRSNGRHGSPGVYGAGMARPSQGEGGEYAHFLRCQSMQEQLLELRHLRDRDFAVSYFSRMDPSLPRSQEGHAVSVSSTNMHQSYMHNQYGNSQNVSHTSRSNQLLYMVTFKAQRADVFYVQNGTGLQVRKGDLVIVEADRGADLGTVASECLSFAEAREVKDKFMQEHYQWLMVFSHHGQNGTIAGPNPNGQPTLLNNANENMGGLPGLGSAQELPCNELKPKMIKRLAQPHEIQILRDKEGNEAKAKRVCQQKVLEHRLSMEILEAEFQVDWKKLTFYYFAEEYINFNSLVTDLFKIYKTRIWMSAINPASFQTPVGGLQIPGYGGPSGSRVFADDIEQLTARRHQRHRPTSTSIGPAHPLHGPFEHTWGSNQDVNVINNMAVQPLYSQPFQRNDMDPRQLDQYPLDYRPGLAHMLNMHPPLTSTSYSAHGLHHSSSFASRPQSSNGGPQVPHASGRDWNQAFQGLSLGH